MRQEDDLLRCVSGKRTQCSVENNVKEKQQGQGLGMLTYVMSEWHSEKWYRCTQREDVREEGEGEKGTHRGTNRERDRDKQRERALGCML